MRFLIHAKWIRLTGRRSILIHYSKLKWNCSAQKFIFENIHCFGMRKLIKNAAYREQLLEYVLDIHLDIHAYCSFIIFNLRIDTEIVV